MLAAHYYDSKGKCCFATRISQQERFSVLESGREMNFTRNKKRYKLAAAGLLCAGLLFTGAMNGYAKEAEGLTLPDKEIVNYFISGFKTTPQSDYGRLRGRMESLVLTDRKSTRLNSSHPK